MKPRIYLPTEKDFTHNGLGILSDCTRCEVTEEANGKYEVELEYPLNSRFKDYFDDGYHIKAKPNDQEDYHIFEIKNTYQDTFNNSIVVYGQSRTYRLGNRAVKHVEIVSQDGAGVMKAITNGMDSTSDIELYSDIPTVSSTTFEARNVLNCIAGEQGSMLQYWGGEIKREPFKLSMLKRRGRDNVGTVRYGKDLNGLKIKCDWTSLITRVLPYADLQQTEDGQTERIYGDKVDSELLKNYPDIHANYIQFTEDQGVTDLESLNRVAKTYFKSINPGSDKPKITIELEIEKLSDSEETKELNKFINYGLFDTFYVYHGLYKIKIESKITTVVYDSLTEKNKKISAGDSRLSFYTQQNYELQETVKTLSKKGYMSDFVDYVTKIISGNDGGHVIWWPKNRPTDLFFCDQPSLEEAKQVLRINKSGIGFSSKGWKGPFNTAWTLDGILTLGDGMLQIGTEGIGKYLENTKNGLQFYNSDDKIGRIGVAAKPFPITGEEELIAEKALSIELDKMGKFIKLQASDDSNKTDVTGIYIPNVKALKETENIIITNMNSDYPKSGINIESKGAAVRLVDTNSPNNKSDMIMITANRVDIKTKEGFFVDGVRIDKNGGGTGGGGINGGGSLESTEDYAKNYITAEFGVDYEKMYQSYLNFGRINAWGLANRSSFDSLNEIIKGQGVSPVFFWAYEASEGYNPSTSFLNHFETNGSSPQEEARRTAAWIKKESETTGDLAWYDAMYPYYTSPSDKQAKGNAYMASTKPGMIARVMLKGTAAATWAMFDPVALNQSVNGVQDYSDPFASQISAIKSWGGHSSAGKDGFALPVKPNTPISSWFGMRDGRMHNGIDFAGQLNDPIFASKAGTVVLSLPTSESGGFGEYVVIDHGDGYFSGYAHQNQRMVSVGDKVTQGQQIGVIGNTGDSEGPHLHFSIMTAISSGYLDPAPFLGLTPG